MAQLRATSSGNVRRETYSENARRRMEVQASVDRALKTGSSPYEEEFRRLSLQQVLAMSVGGVYYRDHNVNEATMESVLGSKYKKDKRMAHFTSNLYWTRFTSISEKEEELYGIKHYVRRPCNPSESAPRLIIAIRGTMVSSTADLVSDWELVTSTLEFTERFERSFDLVKKIIKEFTNWQGAGWKHDFYEQSSSHDLFCDLPHREPCVRPIFKSNALEDYYLCQRGLEEHDRRRDYFKSQRPRGRSCRMCSTSFDNIGDDWYESKKSPVHCLCKKCFVESNSETISDIIITGHSLGASLALLIGKKLAAEENQRCQVHCFNPPFGTIVQELQKRLGVDEAKRMVREKVGPTVFEAATQLIKAAAAVMLDGGEQLMTEHKHFTNLKDWVVVCYINKHDWICNNLKKYYKQKQSVNGGFEVGSQALVSRYFNQQASFSLLVPSVDMHISKQEENPHALRNWYRYPRIDKSRQYRLGTSHGSLITPSSARSNSIQDEEEEEDEQDEQAGYYEEDEDEDTLWMRVDEAEYEQGYYEEDHKDEHHRSPSYRRSPSYPRGYRLHGGAPTPLLPDPAFFLQQPAGSPRARPCPPYLTCDPRVSPRPRRPVPGLDTKTDGVSLLRAVQDCHGCHACVEHDRQAHTGLPSEGRFLRPQYYNDSSGELNKLPW